MKENKFVESNASDGLQSNEAIYLFCCRVQKFCDNNTLEMIAQIQREEHKLIDHISKVIQRLSEE